MDQDGPFVTESTLVEGVGDEVVYSLITGVAVVFAAAFMFYRSVRDRWSQRIHPESAESVEHTREQLRSQNASLLSERRSQRASDDHTCPICLVEARYGTETNCGHLFCGQCIITYWTHGAWLGAVRCPVCRQQVTMLLFSFTQEETYNDMSPEKARIISKIHSYNRRFSGAPRPLLDYLWDLPTLLRHAVTEFFSMGGLIWMFRLRVIICFVAAILYFVSPLDIIPEAAFGVLGFLDDLFIILLLAIYVSIIYRQVMEARARGADPH